MLWIVVAQKIKINERRRRVISFDLSSKLTPFNGYRRGGLSTTDSLFLCFV